MKRQLEEFTKKGTVEDDYQTVFPQIGDSEEENADEVANYADSLGVEHSLEISLAEVTDALERIEQGTYGICANCQKPIPIERLEAMPEATTCLDCE